MKYKFEFLRSLVEKAEEMSDFCALVDVFLTD